MNSDAASGMEACIVISESTTAGTAMTVNLRIKQLRQVLRLSRIDFSRAISISKGHLAGIERERRKVHTCAIRLITSSFKVNENWLRTGEGEMFRLRPEENSARLITMFQELAPKYRNYVLKQINILLQIQDYDFSKQRRRGRL